MLDSLWFTLVCHFRLPGSVDTFYGRVGFLLVDGGLMNIMQPYHARFIHNISDTKVSLFWRIFNQTEVTVKQYLTNVKKVFVNCHAVSYWPRPGKNVRSDQL